jgi:hypothetical protein
MDYITIDRRVHDEGTSSKSFTSSNRLSVIINLLMDVNYELWMNCCMHK